VCLMSMGANMAQRAAACPMEGWEGLASRRRPGATACTCCYYHEPIGMPTKKLGPESDEASTGSHTVSSNALPPHLICRVPFPLPPWRRLGAPCALAEAQWSVLICCIHAGWSSGCCPYGLRRLPRRLIGVLAALAVKPVPACVATTSGTAHRLVSAPRTDISLNPSPVCGECGSDAAGLPLASAAC